MVQSKGTRLDSQRLRIDLTGKKKYSGRSWDLRRVGAEGEMEARRAMPTSGAGVSCAGSGTATSTTAFWKSGAVQPLLPSNTGAGGGQSAPHVNWSRTLLPGPRSG